MLWRRTPTQSMRPRLTAADLGGPCNGASRTKYVGIRSFWRPGGTAGRLRTGDMMRHPSLGASALEVPVYALFADGMTYRRPARGTVDGVRSAIVSGSQVA